MKNSRGITLLALVVTIIVLLIISGISITMISGNNSIINQATEAKIATEYSQFSEALETYKIKQSNKSKYGSLIEDEDLIGTKYKKVFINDTKRELGVVVDFKDINYKSDFGQGGKNILEEDNNDINSTIEKNTIYDLINVYAVDLSDGTLYYINGNKIYSQSDKIEVAENGNTSMKYNVELLNSQYIEKTKFITKWDVTLGETTGSETYSTVILPISTDGQYDATIFWGDGTNTSIKHNIDDINLTSSQLIELATHEYIIEEGEDTIKNIEISGIYSIYDSTVTTSTKSKLIQIIQWGKTGFKKVNFANSSNLSGSIPPPNVEGCFKNCTNISTLFKSTKITGSIPKNLLDSAINCTSLSELFLGTKITSLQEGFRIPNSATSTSRMFMSCDKLETLPESFILPESVRTVKEMLRGCSSLNKISNSFNIPEGTTDLTCLFYGCSSLKKLPNEFKIPQSTTSLNVTFHGCRSLESLPIDFNIPNSVTNMQSTFAGCSSLVSLPSGFTIPENVNITYHSTYKTGLFDGCKKLKGSLTIRANLSDYTNMFKNTSINSGGTLTVNYSSNCSNIDDLLSTGDANYIIKGDLVQ